MNLGRYDGCRADHQISKLVHIPVHYRENCSDAMSRHRGGTAAFMRRFPVI